MKAIRVVAVGIFTSGFLMVRFGADFFRRWLTTEPLEAFTSAVFGLMPGAAQSTGFGFIPVIAFALLCLGAGMFLSALFFTLIDDMAVMFIDFFTMRAHLFSTRNERSDHANAQRQLFQTRYAFLEWTGLLGRDGR
jgi:hypothetical protein